MYHTLRWEQRMRLDKPGTVKVNTLLIALNVTL